MERSLVAGADILDVDLRMTSDGVIVALGQDGSEPLAGQHSGALSVEL